MAHMGVGLRHFLGLGVRVSSFCVFVGFGGFRV